MKSLFVSACSAPKLLKESANTLHLEPDDKFIETLKRYGAMHPQILENKEALDCILPRIRADFSIFETYVYQPRHPLNVPIVSCSGSEDMIIPPERMKAWRIRPVQLLIVMNFKVAISIFKRIQNLFV